MRGLPLLVLLFVLLPAWQPCLSSSCPEAVGTVEQLTASFSEGRENLDGVLITQVCPGKPVEYITLTNFGGTVGLGDLTLSDGEDKITFRTDMGLSPGASITIAANATTFGLLYPGAECIEKGSPLVAWGGRFALADDGDEVLLYEDQELQDAVAYGDSEYHGAGWSGVPLASVGKAHCITRAGDDTNTSVDWRIEPPGRSQLGPATFDVIVEPFSVPENAFGRLIREINLAGVSLMAEVYELSDPLIVEALAACAGRGVEVEVLIEGQPVGGLSNRSKDAVSFLCSAGATVRQLQSQSSYKRYDYVHCKYLVADHRRVLIMSENWGGGLSSNRGWGACLDGEGIARYFESVFRSDMNGPLDIAVPIVGARDPEPAGSFDPLPENVEWYRASVATLISPDYACSSLHQLISEATEMVLVEQMSIQGEWTGGPSLLTDLLDAAGRGVKVRVLLGTSFGGGDNPAVAEYLNGRARAEGLDLEAKLISPYHEIEVMHNKGLIVDDKTVISSINWVNSAIYENREAGVIITSVQVSDLFSGLFWSDWSYDPIPPRIDLPWVYMEVRAGEPLLLDAGGASDNSGIEEYSWDIDMDEVADNSSIVWSVLLPEGNNTITLTVRDRGNNSVQATMWVLVLPPVKEEGMPFAVFLVAPAVVLPLVLLWKRIMRLKGH